MDEREATHVRRTGEWITIWPPELWGDVRCDHNLPGHPGSIPTQYIDLHWVAVEKPAEVTWCDPVATELIQYDVEMRIVTGCVKVPVSMGTRTPVIFASEGLVSTAALAGSCGTP